MIFQLRMCHCTWRGRSLGEERVLVLVQLMVTDLGILAVAQHQHQQQQHQQQQQQRQTLEWLQQLQQKQTLEWLLLR